MVVEGWVIAFFLAQPSAATDFRRATELFSKQDLKGAEAAVEESLHADPRYVPALTLKARLAMISGRMAEARQALETAIGVDRKQPGPRFLLGFCFYLENNFQSAREALGRA